MKEESISIAKLFGLNSLMTAVAVALRAGFHAFQGADWTAVIVDGVLALVLFLFYGLARYSDRSLEYLISSYLLTMQVAVALMWFCWDVLQNLYPPIVILIILLYILLMGTSTQKKIVLSINLSVFVLILLLQFSGSGVVFSENRYWVHYIEMNLYISSAVALLLGIVDHRVAVERYNAEEKALVLERAKKNAEQHRDLLMRLKELQSDFFLEQDLQLSFNKLLRQLLDVTNSSYGAMGEMYGDKQVSWVVKTHASVYPADFVNILGDEQLVKFFKRIYKKNKPIIINNINKEGSELYPYDVTNCLGIPVTYHYKVVGAIVLTNRPGGYNQEVIEYLSPFVSTYGSIIQNIRLKRAQKKYEDELRQAKELAEQDNRLKSQFLTNISHELRTPLSLILGPIALLKKTGFQQLNETQWQQQVTLIERNSKRMLAYIEDIIDLGKLNSDVLKEEPTIINLLIFLEEIYHKQKDIYFYRNLSFQLEYNLSKDLQLYIDACKLEKIIDNLLSNAFKYTKDGTESSILLKAQLIDEELQITCCDSGSGISKEYFECIFNRFYQIQDPNESVFSGTGVGLALCKEFAELLKIRISVESQLGEGSCFTIHIPADKLK